MAADPFDSLAAEIVHGSQEEFVARLTREFAQMLEQGVSNPDRLSVLARLSRDAALAVWSEYGDRVTDECAAAFEEAMAAEDEALLESLEAWAAVDAYDTGYAALRAAEAARGVAEIMRRQNVAMCDALADSWYRITADAVTAIESGGSRREAMERGCAALADAGLETIDYSSGVRTQADAALRRHLVTQWNQARNDLLMRRMDEWGVDLVFTSAHFGARPTHAVWQGKVFSRSGSSPDYPDLVQATGYGTVTGLCGANCRHTMTPYVDGHSQLPDTDWSEQERLTGMTSDEYYEATQRQRRYEAAIRRTKREIAVGRGLGLDMTGKRVLLGRQQARIRQWCAEKGLRRDYERERAYGVATQPRSLKPGGLTVERAVESDRVSRALKTLSVSKDDFREALIAELSARGVSARGLADLPSDLANGIVGDVMAAFRNARGYRRLEAPDSIAGALSATNPRYGTNWRWSNNCQRCVVAYEMRRRGFDVEALPFLGSADKTQYTFSSKGWPTFFGKKPTDLVALTGVNERYQIGSIDHLMSQYGDGSRAVIWVSWKMADDVNRREEDDDSDVTLRHVFVAERINGQTLFVDPQTGSADCRSYFGEVDLSESYLLRIDDATLSPYIGRAIRNRKKR